MRSDSVPSTMRWRSCRPAALRIREQQKLLLNHVNDLDRKLSNARFNVDQLAVGRDAFIQRLAESLEQVVVTDADYDEVADQED